MWNYKFGQFEEQQIDKVKKYMQKQIYFLLLYVDDATKEKYKNVNIEDAFNNILTWFGGLNDILLRPAELVRVMALLEAALLEYQSAEFNFGKYRKLILDAGSEVMKITEVQDAGN